MERWRGDLVSWPHDSHQVTLTPAPLPHPLTAPTRLPNVDPSICIFVSWSDRRVAPELPLPIFLHPLHSLPPLPLPASIDTAAISGPVATSHGRMSHGCDGCRDDTCGDGYEEIERTDTPPHTPTHTHTSTHTLGWTDESK